MKPDLNNDIIKKKKKMFGNNGRKNFILQPIHPKCV